MTANGDKAAFARPAFDGPSPDLENWPDNESVHNVAFDGLTKRELFAAMAMLGNLSTLHHSWGCSPDSLIEACAMLAVKSADALLAELEKVQETGKETDGTSN